MSTIGFAPEGVVKMHPAFFNQVFKGYIWGFIFWPDPDPDKANTPGLRIERIKALDPMNDTRTIVCKVEAKDGHQYQLMLTTDDLVDELDLIRVRYKLGEKIEPGIDPGLGKTDSAMEG